MIDEELVKAIQKAVKIEVRPLKDQVEIVKSKLGTMDFFRSVVNENTRTIKEQQSVMNEKLDMLQEIKETIDKLLEGLNHTYR